MEGRRGCGDEDVVCMSVGGVSDPVKYKVGWLYVFVCDCMYLYVIVCVCMCLYVIVCICMSLYVFVCVCMCL